LGRILSAASSDNSCNRRRPGLAIGDGFPGVLDAAHVGAPWAFEHLYADLAPVVGGYLRVQGAAEPEDVTSEVFLAVFTGIGSFNGTETEFRFWVFTIAHRKLIDERRRLARRRWSPAGDLAAFDQTGDLLADRRDVLVLRVVGDLTRRIGCSRRRQVHRGGESSSVESPELASPTIGERRRTPVSHWGDHISEMPTQRLLDDASVEAVIEGRPVPSDLYALASVVSVLRETARHPVRPSHELAEFMARGGCGGIRRQPSTRWHVAASRLAGMSLRFKLAAGVAAGLTGLTGAAAAAGEMPDAVQASVETAVETAVPSVDVAVETAVDSVEAAVEFVTPIEFPDERVTSKGNVDQATKVDDNLTAPVGVVSPPPYPVDGALSGLIVSPLPSASAMPEPSPDPEPVVVPTDPPTPPPPDPSATPAPEPTPTPTPSPSPEETPTEPPPPPDPLPPADAQAAAGGDTASDPVLTGDSQLAPSSDPVITAQ
jgi:hypothetical protein